MLENLFRALLRSREVRLIAVTAAIWEQAAHLRATTSLKTPDAVHAATARAVGSTLVLTNDPDFRRVPGLPVVILDDIVS